MAMILNEEQNMLKDSAKDFCTNNAPISQLRELRDTDNAEGGGAHCDFSFLIWLSISLRMIRVKVSRQKAVT